MPRHDLAPTTPNNVNNRSTWNHNLAAVVRARSPTPKGSHSTAQGAALGELAKSNQSPEGAPQFERDMRASAPNAHTAIVTPLQGFKKIEINIPSQGCALGW